MFRKKRISEGNYQYEEIDKNHVLLYDLMTDSDYLYVPAVTKGGKKIIGFSRNFTYDFKRKPFDAILFEKSSYIERVKVEMIKSKYFYFPPRAKRVVSEFWLGKIAQTLKCNKDNRYISIIGKNNILNHHPLELHCQNFFRSRLSIRETVRIVGSISFYNSMNLKLIIFPSSVEKIGFCAFQECSCLNRVIFKNNSHLRIIDSCVFKMTSLISFDFPPTVERIGNDAFYECNKLSTITFPRDSKLNSIRGSAFEGTSIKSIDFPPSLEKIGEKAFFKCMSLKSISFPVESKLKSIEYLAFSLTRIKTVDFPSSLETIGENSFEMCTSLCSISFPKNSKLKTIRKKPFI